MPIYKTLAILVISVLISACKDNATSNDKNNPLVCQNSGFDHVIACYTQTLAQQALNYSLAKTEHLENGILLKTYALNSQVWSPENKVAQQQWQHQVTIYIPPTPVKKHALLVINDGTNLDSAANNRPPKNFSSAVLQNIALQTQTVVISVSNIPNQPLTYEHDANPLLEDYSVGRSWDIFLKNPTQYKNMPLHIPMTAAVSQTIRLANQELQPLGINKYVATGASKRGWVTWLAAIANPDIEAIVPIVFDLLNTQKGLEHMYRSYGGNWPMAFHPYQVSNIDQKILTANFEHLMQIEDPLQYQNSPFGMRLTIAKYLINASGDDFYVPDNSKFYYDQLQGVKSLRVAPNSDHAGILKFTERSLISFLNRFQNSQNLPIISEQATMNNLLTVRFSEQPTQIIQWTATNSKDRDFRYACDIRYVAYPFALPNNDQITISLKPPAEGWQAHFIEATFKDGYVATSQVYISPDELYPSHAPEAKANACQSLSGRGLQ